MTHEAIIEKVKKKYAGADEATIHAVLQTLQEAKVDLRWSDLPSVTDVAKEPVIISKPPLQFVGENLSPEEYRKLSLDERGDLKQRLKEQNREWLEEKFSTLNVAWIMVLDGKIIASGDSLQTYPRVEQIREMSSRYGKRPFIFVNDLFLAIEESGMTWHQTVYRNDLCVTKWKQSPFVRINPRRTALAGRDIFLELQPSITLDFANRRTTISAPTTA